VLYVQIESVAYSDSRLWLFSTFRNTVILILKVDILITLRSITQNY